MPDREKVIEGLRRCSCGVPDDCSDCPYDPLPPRICVAHLTKDALELLTEKPKRESRAMLPCKCGGKRREHWYGSDGHEELRCMKCGFTVKEKNPMDVIRQWNKEVSR